MISFDENYAFADGNVIDFNRKISLKENECDAIFWLNFIKENSVFSALNNRIDSLELNKTLRNVVYEVSDRMNTFKHHDFIYEFEKKFGTNLIVEMQNPESFADRLSNAWDFVISKIEKHGLIYEAETASGFEAWLKGKGGQMIESFRDKLFSIGGIAAQAFLSFTGFGQVATSTAFSALLAYDIYLNMNGHNNWLHIVFDVLGLLPGISAMASRVFRSVKGVSAAAPEVAVQTVAKAKGGNVLIKALAGAGNLIGGLIKGLGYGIAWLAQKFGLTWIFNISKNVVSAANNFLNKLVEVAGKASTGKAVAGAKWGTAQNVGQAAAQAGKEAGVAYGVTKGIEYGLPKAIEYGAPIVSRVKNFFSGQKPATQAPKPTTQTPQSVAQNALSPDDEALLSNILDNIK